MSTPTTKEPTTTAPATYKKVGDPAKAQFGHDFLRFLSGDAQLGAEHIKTLGQLLQQKGVLDDLGNVKPEETAAALVASLNELVPDEYTQTKDADGKAVEQRTQELSMAAGVQAQIVAVINSAENATPEAVAKALKENQITDYTYKDQHGVEKKGTSNLFEYLHLMGLQNDGSTFQMEYTADILNALRKLMNSFTPGLGDFIIGGFEKLGLGQLSGSEHDTPDHVKRNRLEMGYDVISRGRAGALADFYGIASEDADGNGLDYNALHMPRNGEQESAFFDGGYNPVGAAGDGTYAFGLGYDERIEYSFEAMILSQWEAEGTVKFDNAVARAEFIDYAQQIYSGEGGQEQIKKAFAAEGINLSENPQFMQDLKELMVGSREKYATGYLVDRYLQSANPDMDFNELRAAVLGVVEDYTRVEDGKEFAARLSKYAAEHPGVTISTVQDLSRSHGLETSAPSEPARAPLKPITTYNPVPSGDGGVGIKRGSGGSERDRTVTDGGKPIKEHFDYCAQGHNAFPCADPRAEPVPPEPTLEEKMEQYLKDIGLAR